jgi:CRP-like cAMP-binding protein
MVIPTLIACFPIEVLSISAVAIREVEPSVQQRDSFLLNQSLQTITLLRISRSRPAETRLFQVLLWLGERFGRDSARGVCLSFEKLNLTHQNLAEISGLTRVTVTKALTHFRKAGLLQKEGADDLLLHGALNSLSTR